MTAPRLTTDQIDFFTANGYLVVADIITPDEVTAYKAMYDDFLSGRIAVGKNRSDLGDGIGKNDTRENITQIMWPSEFVPGLLEMPYHQRALAISRQLMGDDLAMDFDMLINKAPFTHTITPWHQDEAYWLDVPDKRAVSCWLALDNSTVNNGCMWFVPGSNRAEVRTHRFAGKQGGALMCDASENEGAAIELKPGSCTFHHGRTLHYSRGNSTESQRRAFIVNFRPEEMIRYERERGFDHGKNDAGNRELKNDSFKKS